MSQTRRAIRSPRADDISTGALTPTPGGLLHQPHIVVLGRDDTGKPHASAFHEADARAATKAAALMGMHALPVTTDELRQLAAKLPSGRLFSSGRAFVPFVKGSLFEALAVHLPEGAVPPMRVVIGGKPAGDDGDGDGDGAPEPTKPAAGRRKPREANTAADIPTEAQAGGAKAQGGAPRAGGGQPGAKGDGSADDGGAGGGELGASIEDIPDSWVRIRVGSLVLATEGPMEGWFEAIVTEARGEDVFHLRWRDWPDEPHFDRRRRHLALLNPGHKTP